MSETTAVPVPAQSNRNQRLNEVNCFALGIYFLVFTWVLNASYFCTYDILFHVSKVLGSALLSVLTISASLLGPQMPWDDLKVGEWWAI